jgi:hypothetical protein
VSSAPPARNNWNTYDSDEVFHWRARFPHRLGADVLLPWQAAVLDAGERSGVLRIESAEPVGYRRDRDGFVGDWLRAHPDRSRRRATGPRPASCSASGTGTS